MVNSGSFDADGQGDRNAKAGCTQLQNAASSDSTQTSSPVTTSGVTSCNSGFSSRTADSDLPAIGPTPTKTEINGAMPVENNSDDFFAKERSDDEKSRISTSPVEEKTSLCCSLPLDKVQGVLTPFHQIRSDEDATVKVKPTRKLLCLYCDRSFVSANLRQKHVERIHSVKQNRRVSSRRQNQLTVTPCVYCDKLNSTENTLKDLFYHLVNEHSTKYFGCLPCEERFLSSSLLADHNGSNHQETALPETSASLDNISSTSKTSAEEETTEDTETQDEEITMKITRSRVKPKLEDQQNPEESEKDGKIESKKKVVKLKDLRNKKLSVKSSRIALKRRESKRLQAIAKHSECQKKKRTKHSERKITAVVQMKPEQTNSTKSTEKAKSTPSCINPYPEFDCFYRVKKITDHSIDNLKISSLTFDDVFDKAFFNRIKCNIEENLLHHIDGKLFKNEESESRISNFEKVSNISQETQNSASENYGCEISLNAVTPVASLSLNSQFGEDFESQIEYGSKPSKKKTQTKTDEVHYKYFTRRKFQASILEHKENRDLSKLDMWTQLVIKKRQQKMLDEKKTAKEMLEYTAGDEYKNKMKREELNRILDRRGPFEDLKEEASKKVALDKLNSASEDNISHESFTDVREVLNEILNRVFSATEIYDSTQEIETEKTCNKKQDLREIPSYLSLRRTSSLPSEGEIDKSDKITLICSSQETENFELPTNQVRHKNELIELSGEWARCRMYICAACGAKLPNMKYLLEHKSIFHQNVWVQHYEFVGNQSELHRHLSIPALGKVGTMEESIPCKVWKRSDARLCTKCGKQCNTLGELHRHILECGGDWTWMLARKKCKYRPYGAKSRRKRRGLVHRVHLKQKTEPTEKKKYKKTFQGPRQRPSDADTIQRMLANLPAKRSTRKLISLQDGIYRARKNTQINSQLNNNINKKKVKCGKVIYKSSSLKENTEKTINTRVAANIPKNSTVVTRRTLRSISKILSSRIIDTNTKMSVRRKLKAINERRKTRQSQALLDNKKKEIETAESSSPPKSTQKLNNQKENSEETIQSKRTSPRSSPKSMKKVTVKKLLTGKINIKSFFPIKKQKQSSSTEVQINETELPSAESLDNKVKIKKKLKESEDIKTDQKIANENGRVEQKNVKNNTFGKLVRSLSLNKKKITKKSIQQPLPEIDKKSSSGDSEVVLDIQDNIVTSIENVVKQSSETVDKLDVNIKKRKLKNRFRNVVNKVKKLKNDKPPQSSVESEKVCEIRQFNNKDAFLGKSKENDKLDPEEQPEKIIIPSTSDTKENRADISEAVPIVMKFNETNENPPMPETIFKLESNNEKNLQAKGELDFDTQPSNTANTANQTNDDRSTISTEQKLVLVADVEETVSAKLPDTAIKAMQPISVETSTKPKAVPLISPNVKGKIRKPARGLNDCIAMLTSKLQQKTTESTSKIDGVLDLSPTGNKTIKSVPDLVLQKPDCILKIPTFKMPHVEVEEIALDLSMKSKSTPDLTNQKIQNVFRSNSFFDKTKWKANSTSRIFNSVDQTIEDVVGNSILPLLSIDSSSKWSLLDETIQNVIDGHKKYINAEKTIKELPKNSIDDIIEFVITSSRESSGMKEENPILEEKCLSNILSKKIKTKTIIDKKKDIQKITEEHVRISNTETNSNLNTALGHVKSVKKRGRPRKIKVEQEMTSKVGLVATNVNNTHKTPDSLVDNQIDKGHGEELSEQIIVNRNVENISDNHTSIPVSDNKISDTATVLEESLTAATKISVVHVNSTIGEEVVNSNSSNISEEPEKNKLRKNRKTILKSGKSKPLLKQEKLIIETHNSPIIETNLDSILNIEEIKKLEVSTSLASTNDGSNKEISLSNEDEPQILENKILVTEKKCSIIPSDSEDDLPLAALVKSDEKSLDNVEVKKQINEIESMVNTENNCDKNVKFVQQSAQSQLVKTLGKSIANKSEGIKLLAVNKKISKEEISSDSNEEKSCSEIEETDNIKTLQEYKSNNELSDVKISNPIDNSMSDVTMNLETEKEDLELVKEDILQANPILDELTQVNSNEDLVEHVDVSNGKLKNYDSAKQKSNKKQNVKKRTLTNIDKPFVEAETKQLVSVDVLETQHSQTITERVSENNEQISENSNAPSNTSTKLFEDSKEPTIESSDYIFKTPLKKIKSSKRNKNIKRSKSLGDISNNALPNLDNQLEKSTSLKDVSYLSKEQAKENQVDSDVSLDSNRCNGSMHDKLATNHVQTTDESKTNLRCIRKHPKNVKKSITDSNIPNITEVIDNFSSTIDSKPHCRKCSSSTKNDSDTSSSMPDITDNCEINNTSPVLTFSSISTANINENVHVGSISKNTRRSALLARSASISDFSESSNSFLDSSSDFDSFVNTSEKTDTDTTDTSDCTSTKSTPKKPTRVSKRCKIQRKNQTNINNSATATNISSEPTEVNKSLLDDIVSNDLEEKPIETIANNASFLLNSKLEQKKEHMENGPLYISDKQKINDANLINNKNVPVINKRGRKPKNKRRKSKMYSATSAADLQNINDNQVEQINTESIQVGKLNETSLEDTKNESEEIVLDIDIEIRTEQNKTTPENNIAFDNTSTTSDISTVNTVDLKKVQDVQAVIKIVKKRGRRPKCQQNAVKEFKSSLHEAPSLCPQTEKQTTDNAELVKLTSLRSRKKNIDSSKLDSNSDESLLSDIGISKTNSNIFDVHPVSKKDSLVENTLPIKESRTLKGNKNCTEVTETEKSSSILDCDVVPKENHNQCEQDNLTEQTSSEIEFPKFTNNEITTTTKKKRSNKHNSITDSKHFTDITDKNLNPAEIEQNDPAEIVSQIAQSVSLESDMYSTRITNQNLKKGNKPTTSKSTVKSIREAVLSDTEADDLIIKNIDVNGANKRRSKSLQQMNSILSSSEQPNKTNELDNTARRPRSARNKKINYDESNENEDENEELDKILPKDSEDHKQQKRSKSGRRNINLLENSEIKRTSEINTAVSTGNENTSTIHNPLNEELNISKSVTKDLSQSEESNKISLELTIPLPLETEPLEISHKIKEKERRDIGNKKGKNTTKKVDISNIQKNEDSKCELGKSQPFVLIENGDIVAAELPTKNLNNCSSLTESGVSKISVEITSDKDNAAIIKNDWEKTESESNHEPPIKLIINKQKTRRKSKSFKKIDLKGQDDLFQDFALVIKKPKRILPIITFCNNDNFMKDTYPNYLKKTDVSPLVPVTAGTQQNENIKIIQGKEKFLQNEKPEAVQDLDASVEEMDMELDDEIPITSNIIERNDFSFTDGDDQSNCDKTPQETVLKIPKKVIKTKRKIKKKSKTSKSTKTSKNSVQGNIYDGNTPDKLVSNFLDESEKYSDIKETLSMTEGTLIAQEKSVILKIDSDNVEETQCDAVNSTFSEPLLEDSQIKAINISIKKKSKSGRVSKKKQTNKKALPKTVLTDVIHEITHVNNDENVQSIPKTDGPQEKDIDSIYTFTESEDLEIEKPIEMPKFTRKQANNLLENKVDTNNLLEVNEIEETKSDKTASHKSEVSKNKFLDIREEKQKNTFNNSTDINKTLSVDITSSMEVLEEENTTIVSSIKNVSRKKSKHNRQANSDEKVENKELLVQRTLRKKCNLQPKETSDMLDTSEEIIDDAPNSAQRISKLTSDARLDDSFFDMSDEIIEEIDKTVSKRKTEVNESILTSEGLGILGETSEKMLSDETSQTKLNKEMIGCSTTSLVNTNDQLLEHKPERLTFKLPSRIKYKFNTSDNSSSIELDSSGDELQTKIVQRKSKPSKEAHLDILEDVYNTCSSRSTLRRKSKSGKEMISDSSEEDIISKSSKRNSRSKRNTHSTMIKLSESNKQEEELRTKSLEEQSTIESEEPSDKFTVHLEGDLHMNSKPQTSLKKQNENSNIDISMESCSAFEEPIKPVFIRKSKINSEVNSDQFIISENNGLSDSLKDKLPLKTVLRRKSKIDKMSILNMADSTDNKNIGEQERLPLKSLPKRKSRSLLSDTLSIETENLVVEERSHSPVETLKPTSRRKSKFGLETSLESAISQEMNSESLHENITNISSTEMEEENTKELSLKSRSKKKSKITKEIHDHIDSFATTNTKVQKPILRRKSKNNKEIIDDVTNSNLVDEANIITVPVNEKSLPIDIKPKLSSKRKSKFNEEISSEQVEYLENTNNLEISEENTNNIDEPDFGADSKFNQEIIRDTEESLPLTKLIWTAEGKDGNKISLKTKRKSKLNKVSSNFTSKETYNIDNGENNEIISSSANDSKDILEVISAKITIKKKSKNNKLSAKSIDTLKVHLETIDSAEIANVNKNIDISTIISANIEASNQSEIEKIAEDIEKTGSKKKSKFTREVTLEDSQENLSVGAIKENNLDLEDVGRRKSIRTAKVKALEHIHDEALAELTDSQRNRDLEKVSQDNIVTDTKKNTSKRSRKSEKMSTLIDNFQFRQKILEEEKSPLFADLVADLEGLEELENSIERELNAEINEKDDNPEIQHDNVQKIHHENNSFTDLSVQDSQELRRSRRESRKVTSYNENDLIDPLLDIIDGKKKGKRKDSERPPSSETKITKKITKDLDKKINSDELFDLLKASTTEQIFMPKPQNSFLSNLDDTSRDFNMGEHFDHVFDNTIEKSNLLIQNSSTDKNDKTLETMYEFTDISENSKQSETTFIERKKVIKKGKRNPSPVKINIEESLDSTSNIQELPSSEETLKNEKDESNYCEICNKSFIRIENLIKHKRTLTHIQKLSELEAREAQKKSESEQVANESESVCDISIEIPDNASKNSIESSSVDINIHNILLESEKPGNHSQIVHSAFTNNDSLKLADIISDVLNKPVLPNDKEEPNNYVSSPNEIQHEYKRYKSLGERKSFDSDNILLPNENHILPVSEPYISKTTILEKQISLLENIIESQTRVNYIDDVSMSSNNSVTEVTENIDMPKLDISLSKSDSKPLSDDSFLKPTQYEEISEDSINIRNYEDQKLRKTLNRDEELFLECCSLLKSGSEVSSYSNQRSQKVSNSMDLKQYGEPESLDENRISPNPECGLVDDYSNDNSRIPTPLGDSYDDDASDSNTISSNWDINKMAPVFEGKEEHVGTNFTFQEVLITAAQNKYGHCSKESISSLPESETADKPETNKKEANDGFSSDNKKIITKGARKVFEGLKVSIPTEELNLAEVLNCSPKVNKTEMTIQNVSDDHTVPDIKDSSPPKPSRTARKSKPVKKSQIGSALLFKMNKKKMVSPSINSPPKQIDDEFGKSYDVYDFEETQDNTDVFTKPDFKIFRSKKPNENPDIESDSENRDDYLGSFVAEPESVTSSVSSSSSLKKSKAQENITKKKCMIMGRIFKSQARSKLEDIDEEMREIPIIGNDELVENYVENCKKIIKNEMKPKLSEKEINQLFDQLLENKNIEKKSANSTLTKTTTKSKPDTKKLDFKKKKLKSKKRIRTNSDSTDDEFSINKTSKRSYKKSCKAEDNCINLEQELKECIGVASRKSQRKCTSGKQNVLVEYWSSDDSQFEALLESQKIEVKSKPTVLEESIEIEISPIPTKTLEEEIESKLNEKTSAPSETIVKPKNQEKRTQRRNKSTSDKKEKTQFIESEKTDAATTNRRKRAAANPLYHWSSSSEDESQDLIEVKPLRDEEEDEEDRPIQHGWIVGDSPKKLVTMLAQAKGKKTDIDCVKEQGKKRTNTVS